MPSCRLVVSDAGLPNRDERLLRREAAVLPDMVASLRGSRRGRGAGEGGAPPAAVEAQQVLQALGSEDITARRAGAFVAGRCECDDAGAAAELDGGLRAQLADDPAQLGAQAVVHVEAAMSLVLRGHTDEGRAALAPLATGATPPGMADAIAAFYLAELGDPSGWPTVLRDLRSDDGFTRLIAARHLVGFLPWDGGDAGAPVDVVAALAGRLADPDRLVAAEVPGLLVEVGGSRARQALEAARPGVSDPELRAAVDDALRQLG